MSVTGILVNRYDEKNGLRKKAVFACTSMKRRNEYRREDFRISLDEPQCPVYLDNRCCGTCDLTPTCQFAVACNCYGYTKGALGGTDEGYYMRNHDYAKYGRIGEDGKFDWDYYKLNQAKERLKPGKFIVIKELKHSPMNEEIVEYLKGNATIIGKIQQELQENGLLAVQFELNGEEKTLEAIIHHEDVQYGLAYENKNRII